MMKMQLFFASMLLVLLATVSFAQTRDDDRFYGGRDNDDRDRQIPVTVFQAAGPNAASIQSVVDQYRLALGGNNNGNGPAATSGRREINWDGGSPTVVATAVGATPFDVFLNNRGARFIAPGGTGFVQATPQGLADTFNNPSYAQIFQAFSQSRLFSPIGSRVTDSVFFVPGTAGATPAVTNGFGAVFTDVDQQGDGDRDFRGDHDPDPTQIEYLDVRGRVLFRSVVPASPGNGGLSFFGIVINDARIAKVRIITDSVPGRDDSAKRDVGMLDDFIYGEPQATPSN